MKLSRLEQRRLLGREEGRYVGNRLNTNTRVYENFKYGF